MIEEHLLYVKEVKYQASKYNPKMNDYRYNENVKAKVYIIDHADCDEMKELFIRNPDWWPLPMLGDKIVRMCF